MLFPAEILNFAQFGYKKFPEGLSQCRDLIKFDGWSYFPMEM